MKNNGTQSPETPATEPVRKHRYSKTARIWTIVGSSVMAVVGVLCLVVSMVGMHWIGRIGFDDPDDGTYNPNITITTEQEDTQYTDPFDEELYNKAGSVADIPLRGNEGAIRNIMLIGIDSNTFAGRSDTMIILSINQNTKTIRLVSLQRDTWVSIPGRDRDGDGVDDIDKLSHSYAYGRFNLLSKTIAQNFRLDIDDYIGVNFKVLPVLIDAMGGLDVELTAREMTQIPARGCTVTASSKDPSFVPLSGNPGVHHLTGFQALEYARIRAIDNDFKRAERQRKVIGLLIEKAKTMSYADLVSVVYEALTYISTNMTADEFLGFAANAMTYTSYALDMSHAIPAEGTYKGTTVRGGSGLQLLDPRAAVTDLHRYLYE